MKSKHIYLEQIIASKRIRLDRYENISHNRIERIALLPSPPSFYKAMEKEGLSIIGEIKRASPSKGLIKQNFEPIQLAKEYEGIVDAISVLTEEDYFMGHDAYLYHVSKEVATPTLCKDFIIDATQIYSARELGASCVLLIVAILQDDQLKTFMQLAEELGMDALVEVHDASEIKIAVQAGAKIIGINNRDLTTFEVEVSRTITLRKLIPENCLVISESGIAGHKEIMMLRESGIDGILVGESFMRCADIGAKAEELRQAYETQD